jgi:hypothetical protein
MKFEIDNGSYVGTAEWLRPGEVALDIADPTERTWFERYFGAEDAFLTGPVECAEMSTERRDESEAAFTRATYKLAAYAYKVRAGDGRRHGGHSSHGDGG